MSKYCLLMASFLFPVLVLANEEPPPLCGIEDSPPPKKDHYIVKYDLASRCESRSKSLAPGDGPDAPVYIECFSNGTGIDCEAWPQGEVTYTWTASSNVSLDNPGPNAWPQQQLFCSNPSPGTGGSVQVTVTSKFGLSSQAYTSFSCSPTDPN